jgi:hypothetical protein
LYQTFPTPWFGWGKEDAIGLVGEILHTPEDPDEAIYLVIERFDVIVPNRPVVTQTVETPSSEIIRSKPQGDASPVVGPSPEHPTAVPIELCARRPGVGFAFDIPTTIARIKLAEGPQSGPRPPSRCLIVPGEHRRVLLRPPQWTRLEDDDIGPGLAQHVGCHTSTGTGADDTNVGIVSFHAMETSMKEGIILFEFILTCPLKSLSPSGVSS